MAVHYCQHCGTEVSDNRWRKGKKNCVECALKYAVIRNAAHSYLDSILRDNATIAISGRFPDTVDAEKIGVEIIEESEGLWLE